MDRRTLADSFCWPMRAKVVIYRYDLTHDSASKSSSIRTFNPAAEKEAALTNGWLMTRKFIKKKKKKGQNYEVIQTDFLMAQLWTTGNWFGRSVLKRSNILFKLRIKNKVHFSDWSTVSRCYNCILLYYFILTFNIWNTTTLLKIR